MLALCVCFCFFFFFQAEDGIRDVAVTGVQTCALPISGVPVPRLSLRRGAALRRYGRQRPPGRARGCERRGVLPSLLLSPSRGGATGGLLPRGGAALGREAASSAWRHRVLSRGRCGVHRGGARALPRRAARGPGRGAARAVGREDRAAGWRRDRTHRATGRGAPANVAGTASGRRAPGGVARPPLRAPPAGA